jgi:hypothetical protein
MNSHETMMEQIRRQNAEMRPKLELKKQNIINKIKQIRLQQQEQNARTTIPK